MVSVPVRIKLLPVTVPVKVGDDLFAFDAISVLLVEICDIKSAPPFTPFFVNMPVTSIFPLAYNPLILVILLLLALGSKDVNDTQSPFFFPSKSSPVHLIEPGEATLELLIMIAPLE